MKFSVIGDIPAALPLMRQIEADASHQFAPCCLSGPLADAASRAGIPLRLESEPENAFLTPEVEVVILAFASTEETLRLTRAASQAERHVVVVPPAEASTAFGFELHLLMDESSRAVIPIPGRMRLADLNQNADGLLPESVPNGIMSTVRQIVMDVSLPDDQTDSLPMIQLEALDIVSALGLRYTQVTAIESRATDGALIARLLTLGTSASSEQVLPPATITFRPAGSVAAASAEVASPSPAASGNPPDDSPEISLQIIQMDGTAIRPVVRPTPELLSRLMRLFGSRDACSGLLDSFSTALELSDAARKSLVKRRTVDVYFDSGSERSVFKSQMTAIGCGVLTWTLLGMVAFLIAAQMFQMPPAMLHVGRILWILPIGLFLLFQFLLPLTRDRKERKQNP